MRLAKWIAGLVVSQFTSKAGPAQVTLSSSRHPLWLQLWLASSTEESGLQEKGHCKALTAAIAMIAFAIALGLISFRYPSNRYTGTSCIFTCWRGKAHSRVLSGQGLCATVIQRKRNQQPSPLVARRKSLVKTWDCEIFHRWGARCPHLSITQHKTCFRTSV